MNIIFNTTVYSPEERETIYHNLLYYLNSTLKPLFYSPSFVKHPDQMISYALASVMLRDEADKLRKTYQS